MRRHTLLVLSLLCAVTCLACPEGSGPTPPSQAGPAGRGVVWIVIDATRADVVGAHGGALPTTPRIDALAAEGVTFDRAYAQATWTLPSTASFLSGLYPPESLSRGRVTGGQTLAPGLRAAGVRTAAFSENPYVTRQHGFDDGFDVFREYFPFERIRDSPRAYPRMDSAQTIDDAIAWLEAEAREAFFLYVHLLPPHAPYDPPPPFAGRFDPDYAGDVHGRPEVLLELDEEDVALAPRDLEHLRLAYQENLAYADHQIGRLVDGLERLGALDRALLIVSSDHGEGFREHGFLLHNVSLYEEVIHVPLVLRLPEGPERARLPARWPGVVEIRQLPATVLDFLDVDGPRHTESLLETVARGAPGEGRALAFSKSREGDRLTGIVSDGHKLVRRGPGRAPLLFDLRADPGETRDVFGSGEAAARRARLLEKQFRERLAARVETREQAIDEETRARLRALGYAE